MNLRYCNALWGGNDRSYLEVVYFEHLQTLGVFLIPALFFTSLFYL